VFIAGMFAGRGRGVGEALGVGDGIGIEWPVCCASADLTTQRNIRMTNSPRTISGKFIRILEICHKQWRGLDEHRAMLRRT